MVEEAGFEPAYAKRTDLQSVSFNHSDTPPNASAVPDSHFSQCLKRAAARQCHGLRRVMPPGPFSVNTAIAFCCFLVRFGLSISKAISLMDAKGARFTLTGLCLRRYCAEMSDKPSQSKDSPKRKVMSDEHNSHHAEKRRKRREAARKNPVKGRTGPTGPNSARTIPPASFFTGCIPYAMRMENPARVKAAPVHYPQCAGTP